MLILCIFQGLTENEIIAQGLNFLGAGYETTSVTLALVLYCLSLHPECQEKLVAEINQTSTIQDIDYDTLMKMQYLDAVINETLRFICSVVRYFLQHTILRILFLRYFLYQFIHASNHV